MTDNQIKRSIYDSPEDGYRKLFDQYHSYVYTIVFQILRGCGSQRDVEDCVVDVFSDVLIHYDSSYEGSIKAFIGTVAKNKAINLKHSISTRSFRTVSMDEMEIPLPSQQNLQEEAELSDRARILIDKVKELGEPDSTIIIQKYFFDRNSKQIGKIVGMSSTAVRMRCSRALKRLRSVLEELDITL
ncbi:MAG: RNA polymerase sigma factor [Ruminococcus sp.]|nr:RNA polymerase sigma factor [Ruminococcus sp.]